MERLRGFGAALGTLATCACARLDLADGDVGILIVATEPVGRTMPLLERLQRLVCDADAPVAAFESDGHFVAASPAAGGLVDFHSLAEAGLEEARLAALKEGGSQAALGGAQVRLQRVGRGADLGLLVFITPPATERRDAPSGLPASKDEPPHTSNEAVAAPTSPEDLANEQAALHAALRDKGAAVVHDIADGMDGSISAEHGLGSMKSIEALRYKSPVEVEALRAVRAALDPGRIMNPRVLF